MRRRISEIGIQQGSTSPGETEDLPRRQERSRSRQEDYGANQRRREGMNSDNLDRRGRRAERKNRANLE